jgi:tRNA (uracil-5-)-methyltransferase TRM9
MRKQYVQYLLQKTKEDYNRAAEVFSRQRPVSWPEMRFLFDDYLSAGDRMLDLGCGNGRFFEIVREKRIDYYGVDPSEKLIGLAKEKYPEGKFQVADGLNLPFSDNYFDKVYCIAVLHHIPSNQGRCQFVSEARRVLKKDGLFIATCWNLWSSWKKTNQILKSALLKILGRSKMDFKDILQPFSGIKDCYFHCFTKKELEKLVKKAGFKIKQSGEIIVSQEKRPNSNLYIIAEKP